MRAALDYDPAGNRVAEIVNGSGTTAGQFNNLNQLTGLTSSPASTTVSGYTSSAISSATVDAVPATITSGTNFSANVPLPTGATNVVSVVAQPTSSSGSITTQRYQVVTSGTAPTSLSYDANGNCTQDESGNTYTWDALNRLTEITYPSTAYTTFAYDGLSRRTQIAEYNSSHSLISTKNYLWIGQEIAEERDASNTVIKRFFPQGEQQSGTNYYYTRDHLGSVREMCSSTGTITSRMAYDQYGRTTTVSGTILPTKQYAGMYWHQPSGLYLPILRGGYDSNLGRFIQRDPIRESGGLNLYEYTFDDPSNLTDPTGLDTTWTVTITPQSPFTYPYGPKNATVDITAKNPCCKNIQFIQLVSSRWVLPVLSPANWGNTQPDTQANPSTAPFYPVTREDNDGTHGFQDAPGPGMENGDYWANALRRATAFGLISVEEFVTCAICRDPGAHFNQNLGCIHWTVYSNGVEQTHTPPVPYTGN